MKKPHEQKKIKIFSLCNSIIKPQEIKYIKLFNNELMCSGACKIIIIISKWCGGITVPLHLNHCGLEQ